MQEHVVATLVHGTYLVEPPSGPVAAETAGGPPLLVGFHGYGESAARHLAELVRIPGSEGWLRCAVQALHPFYGRGGSEVVASWMTRHDRERAIEDNVRYAGTVVSRLKREHGGGEQLVYAGFSQGVAMAYRAAAGAGHACAGLVVLGADVPPELARRDLAGFPPVLLGRGHREDWYTAEKMAADVDFLRSRGVDVRPLVYEGAHEWTEEFRRAAGEFLAEVSGARRPGPPGGRTGGPSPG
jgi:predicted esterase